MIKSKKEFQESIEQFDKDRLNGNNTAEFTDEFKKKSIADQINIVKDINSKFKK